jgi:hypothetical protein
MFLSSLISALSLHELCSVSENCACNSESGHITYLPVLLRFQYTKNKSKSIQRRNWSDGTLSTNRFREKLMETSFRTQQEGYFPHCVPYCGGIISFCVIRPFNGIHSWTRAQAIENDYILLL